MKGAGSVIITHQSGWACSKEAYVDMEFDIKPDKTAKRTLVVHIKGLFNAVGKASGVVKAIFRYDDGKRVSFDAVLYGESRMTVTGDIKSDFETIFKEINKWQITRENY